MIRLYTLSERAVYVDSDGRYHLYDGMNGIGPTERYEWDGGFVTYRTTIGYSDEFTDAQWQWLAYDRLREAYPDVPEPKRRRPE